jgi:hypothetical protein
MTRRGRVSIAATALTVMLAVVWLADRSFSGNPPVEPEVASLPAASEVASAPVASPEVALSAPSAAAVRPAAAVPAAALPSVAAAPIVVAALPQSRPVAERLPVSRRALDLHVVDEHGVDQGLVSDSAARGRLYETVSVDSVQGPVPGPLRIEYTLDAELTRAVFKTLENGRVKLGNVVLLDPSTGRVLAYAATNADLFPPTRNYPAASLVKVITAAAALDVAPEKASLPCRFSGSPYRLTPSARVR